MSGELTSATIAARYGISKRTAERWLADMEREHGPSVVARRGRRLVTTEKAWAKVAPTIAGDGPANERMSALEERIEELELKVDLLCERRRLAS